MPQLASPSSTARVLPKLDPGSGCVPLWGLEVAGLEAAAVIASTISSCSSLTSVGAVLVLYKAGSGPGTDPVLPKASSARPGGQRLELHLAPGRHSDNMAGGTMRQRGRAALLVALLLLAQLRPGSSQWSPATEAATGVQDPNLRWSPGARNQGGGARALLLLLAERFPRRAGSGTAGERQRRDDPPLSIDLTFHLLRTLLELARTQSQRERAEQNRIILNAVGK
ncbi:urocortin [Cricetulus griseus]|uniref:Urocortin n=2 Tax=Cricetulus griseus TaxID=10029 RepID=A0A9J7GA49_CRIGR|nr:urocortin [Cricetulus griseus]XP_027280277.1 urocortin [Cricetulus griseus]